jgi:hypothetical protein
VSRAAVIPEHQGTRFLRHLLRILSNFS